MEIIFNPVSLILKKLIQIYNPGSIISKRFSGNNDRLITNCNGIYLKYELELQ